MAAPSEGLRQACARFQSLRVKVSKTWRPQRELRRVYLHCAGPRASALVPWQRPAGSFRKSTGRALALSIFERLEFKAIRAKF